MPSDLPQLKIVYPKPGQRIAAVDSTFVFGHVRGMDRSWELGVLVNGRPAITHHDGGFLAYIALRPGASAIKVEAVCRHPKLQKWLDQRQQAPQSLEFGFLNLADSVMIDVSARPQTARADSLYIVAEHASPAGDLVLADGDVLRLAIRATPGCRAWACIAGAIDSLPMIEEAPRPQTYWGEDVFGSQPTSDSLRLKGLYVAALKITPQMRTDSVRVDYWLAAPDPLGMLDDLFSAPITTEKIARFWLATTWDGEPAVMQSNWGLSVNPADYPFAVRFTDSVQIVRHGPRKGYLTLFQPEGVEALVTGAVGDWYRLQLSEHQLGWAHKKSVTPLEQGKWPPVSFVRSVRAEVDSRHVVVQFPLAGKHVFRVHEEARDQISVRLYGVYADTDWIRYNDADGLIDRATWSQPETGVYEFSIRLSEPIWGYDAYYRGNTLYLQINRPPENVGSLKGKRIVVDPGHYSDPGAIGPTGLTEAEANLGIALQLTRELAEAGALVTLTRSDNHTHVDLYRRPEIARLARADMFISVHNNALPDGVNPFVNNGSSSYYYHLHSLDLARHVQYRLAAASGLADHGLYHGNFAVIRPTQYPAILVECAFMMIPEQEAALRTERYQKQLARGIRQGIEDFLREFKREHR